MTELLPELVATLPDDVQRDDELIAWGDDGLVPACGADDSFDRDDVRVVERR